VVTLKRILFLAGIILIAGHTFLPDLWAQTHPPAGDELLRRADDYFQRQYYGTAIKLYQAAESVQGGFGLPPESLFRLGISHFNMGQYREAEERFRELESRPVGVADRVKQERYLGYTLANLEKWDEAAVVLRRVMGSMTSYHSRFEVGLLLSRSLARAGEEREALTVLQELYKDAWEESYHRLLTDGYREIMTGMKPEEALNLLRVSPGIIPPEEWLGSWLRELIEEGRHGLVLELINILYPTDGGVSPGWEIRALEQVAREARGRSLVKIGVLLPLSGDYQVFGRRILQAYNLAVASSTDLDVVLVIRDTQGDPAYGRKAAVDLMELDGVTAILGPILSSVAEKVAIEADRRRIPVFSPAAQSPGLPQLTPYFFRNCLTLEKQAREMARAAVSGLGLTRFAILAPGDSYGEVLTRTFWDEILKLGGEILAFADYELEQTDFNDQIVAIKGEDPEKEEEEKDPLGLEEEDYIPEFEAVFLPDSYYRVGLIAPQLTFHDIDLGEVTLLGSSGLNSQEFVEIGEEYIEGTIFVDGFFNGRPSPEVARFVGRYRSRYQEEPDTLAAQAYDAAAILFHLVRRGLEEPEEIRYGLASLEDFPGVCGATGMDPHGESLRDPVFIVVFRGHLTELQLPSGQGPIRHPFPLTLP
jgi:branched-chain amino acid transport system substrate-binding protein